MWQVWFVTETSHEWIEWVKCPKGVGKTKDEALVNSAKGLNLVHYETREPVEKRTEGSYLVCLKKGDVPNGIPFEKAYTPKRR